MNSRLMYSSVMFDTGRNSVVPGLLAFQWLNTNRPGRPSGISARPSLSCFFAPRTIWRMKLTWASRPLFCSVEISPSSGMRFHMSRK